MIGKYTRRTALAGMAAAPVAAVLPAVARQAIILPDPIIDHAMKLRALWQQHEELEPRYDAISGQGRRDASENYGKVVHEAFSLWGATQFGPKRLDTCRAMMARLGALLDEAEGYVRIAHDRETGN